MTNSLERTSSLELRKDSLGLKKYCLLFSIEQTSHKLKQVLLSAFGFTLLFLQSTAHANTSQCDNVILSGHPNLPPVVWGDYQKTLGAAPELVSEILTREGINVVSDYQGGINRVLRKLESGDIALNPAMVRTRELEKTVQFIEPPIFTQKYAVLVKKGKHKDLNSWDDLRKLLGVTPKGLSLGAEFDEFSRKNLRLIRTFHARQGLLMLNVGRVDYAIYPDIQGDLFMSLLDFEGRFEKASVDIASFKLYVGVSRKLDCKLPLDTLSEQLNYMLNSGRADHTVNDNLYKWMDFSLSKRPR
ncbi:substrate-binding periplasmic protein [Endozoicomonas arenosclerae]|uniref:substrate-binding periplasmic protein n=1 Tax=Endozoicomonas arenosclerae TaxID=1633495 RepID=UPI0007825164|nr:transporter substrate-binding domain-containing protein [Endozoicomonas arenosclerae]